MLQSVLVCACLLLCRHVVSYVHVHEYVRIEVIFGCQPSMMTCFCLFFSHVLSRVSH